VGGQACGYAGVVDVETGELEDHMNSFFLAETLKYLYLLFDDGSNFVHSGARGRRYLFNTEGHVLPVRRQFFAPANRSLGTPPRRFRSFSLSLPPRPRFRSFFR
jgi:hypothetical protein